jgi:NAD(P)-dependent dehydrogenase (short-subunit alcohol dehydrogenase family)
VPDAHVRAATDAARPDLQATVAIAAILTGWFSSSMRQAASQSHAESRTNHSRGELVHRIVALTDVCVRGRGNGWAGAQPHARGGRIRDEAAPASTPAPGSPRKIADAIVFLAAKRASFITSTVLGIDGGSIRAMA